MTHPKDLAAALGYICQLRNIDLDCRVKRHAARRNQAMLLAMGVRNKRRAPRTEAEIIGIMERFYRARAEVRLAGELRAARDTVRGTLKSPTSPPRHTARNQK